MRFNNIRLLVNDFDKCLTFYNDVLGLKCTWGKLGDNFASFDFGIESGLAIFKADLMSVAIGNAGAKKNENLQDSFAIIVEVDNVDETYMNLEKKGVKFLTAPMDMPVWGIRVSHFRDPENNLFEIFNPLPKDK